MSRVWFERIEQLNTRPKGDRLQMCYLRAWASVSGVFVVTMPKDKQRWLNEMRAVLPQGVPTGLDWALNLTKLSFGLFFAEIIISALGVQVPRESYIKVSTRLPYIWKLVAREWQERTERYARHPSGMHPFHLPSVWARSDNSLSAPLTEAAWEEPRRSGTRTSRGYGHLDAMVQALRAEREFGRKAEWAVAVWAAWHEEYNERLRRESEERVRPHRAALRLCGKTDQLPPGVIEDICRPSEVEREWWPPEEARVENIRRGIREARTRAKRRQRKEAMRQRRRKVPLRTSLPS